MPNTKIDKIQSKLPDEKLPPKFATLKHVPALRIQWSGFKHYSLKKSAGKEAIPFARLPDGGLLAFWFHQLDSSGSTPPESAPATDDAAIVHIGGHGELEVLAISFAEFLKAINSRSSGLPDIDDDEGANAIPGVDGKPIRRGLTALKRQFQSWFAKQTSLLKPNETPAGERLRQSVLEVAKTMLRDGLSKVYSAKSDWWSFDFKIEQTANGISIKYLDYGKWYPLPAEYKLEPLVAELLSLVNNKNRKHYELSIASYGGVSIDEDKELLLSPPE